MNTSGLRRDDDLERAVLAQEVGRQHLDRRPGRGARGSRRWCGRNAAPRRRRDRRGRPRSPRHGQGRAWRRRRRRASGSSSSSGSGRPVRTLQKAQARVQVSPMIMKVAWRLSQHSPMLGQRASSQTVASLSSRTSAQRLGIDRRAGRLDADPGRLARDRLVGPVRLLGMARDAPGAARSASVSMSRVMAHASRTAPRARSNLAAEPARAQRRRAEGPFDESSRPGETMSAEEMAELADQPVLMLVAGDEGRGGVHGVSPIGCGCDRSSGHDGSHRPSAGCLDRPTAGSASRALAAPISGSTARTATSATSSFHHLRAPSGLGIYRPAAADAADRRRMRTRAL